MSAPRIIASATATPPSRRDQATLLRMTGYDGQRAGFFSNSQIVDPETFTADESVEQLNDDFLARDSARLLRYIPARGRVTAGPRE